MKWIKLFEGFREDFYKSVDDLQTEYKSNLKKLFSDSKAKVDEFMELFNNYDCIRGEDIIIDRFNDFLKEIGKPVVDSVKGYNNI